MMSQAKTVLYSESDAQEPININVEVCQKFVRQYVFSTITYQYWTYPVRLSPLDFIRVIRSTMKYCLHVDLISCAHFVISPGWCSAADRWKQPAWWHWSNLDAFKLKCGIILIHFSVGQADKPQHRINFGFSARIWFVSTGYSKRLSVVESTAINEFNLSI